VSAPSEQSPRLNGTPRFGVVTTPRGGCGWPSLIDLTGDSIAPRSRPSASTSPLPARRVQVRVNDEIVLDAGRGEGVTGPNGAAWVIRPPETTFFHQVLAYLRTKPDPATRPSGSAAGREGVAAAGVVLRWGSYLAVLLDRDKPAHS